MAKYPIRLKKFSFINWIWVRT